MPKRFGLALAALLVIPLAASADDEAPVDEAPVPVVESPPAPVATSTTTTTTTTEGTTTTTTTTTGAPGLVAPIAPAPGASGVVVPIAPAPVAPTPVAPVAAPIVDEDPCSTYKSGRWRERMRGRLSIGFSKSHVELKDAEDEGNQKSFVARLNGRRGWSLELEVGKLKLDSGDTAKTGGISVVKAFGKRKLAPYVLAGGGGGRYEYADGTEQKVRFGEVGAGIMFRKKRFSIGVDVRRGVRAFEEDEVEASAMPTAERMSTPGDDDHEHDHYTRGRIIALVNF